MCDCLKNRSTTSQGIEKRLKEDRKAAQYHIRLLLLGIGGSGKSTVCKQLRIIYDNGFSTQELQDYKQILQLNVLKSMKALVQQVRKLNLKVPREVRSEFEFFEKINPIATSLEESMVPQIKKLWDCEILRETYHKYYNVLMASCSQYCIENAERIAKPDYVPSYADILQVRQRTTGVIETVFKVEKYTFTLVDVGGQRSERRKWIHCFENVTALLYCVALDEYDMKVPEDENMNRMHEAIKVFEDTVNEHWFSNTSVIVFLNKEDLFKEKIKEVDLNVCFPEYKGGKDKDAAISYIKEILLSKNKFPDKKTFYIHVTVATNTENVRYVFNAVKDMIFSERMKMSGLMF
jgi:guanine nucleotide-binding protein G(i) subunit alpha